MCCTSSQREPDRYAGEFPRQGCCEFLVSINTESATQIGQNAVYCLLLMDPDGPPFSERNPESDIHNLIQKVIEIILHTFSPLFLLQDGNIGLRP